MNRLSHGESLFELDRLLFSGDGECECTRGEKRCGWDEEFVFHVFQIVFDIRFTHWVRHLNLGLVSGDTITNSARPSTHGKSSFQAPLRNEWHRS